jgi:hypothetical protein
MIRTAFFGCVGALALASMPAPVMAGGPAAGVGVDPNAYTIGRDGGGPGGNGVGPITPFIPGGAMSVTANPQFQNQFPNFGGSTGDRGQQLQIQQDIAQTILNIMNDVTATQARTGPSNGDFLPPRP